jgi:hypothetical protein
VQPQRGQQQVEELAHGVERGCAVHCSVEAGVAKPAATSSGPNRLSGRRRQATRPAAMNGSVHHSTSAIRSGRW